MSTDSDRIRDALAGQRDADLTDIEWQDEKLLSVMAHTFRGRRRGFVIFFFIVSFVYGGLLIACLVKFFQAEAVKDQIMYAAGTLFCALGIITFKVWYWMEMNKHTLAREIKRLELQVARLSEKLAGGA